MGNQSASMIRCSIQQLFQQIMVAIFHVTDSHRIIVQNVVIWHDRLGKSVDEIDQKTDTQNTIYRLTQTF